MHNLDENLYKQKKVDCQPWLRSSEHDIQQRLIREILLRNANATIAESAFIATDANIFTSSFHLGGSSWVASGAIIRGDVYIGNDCSVNVNAHIAGKVSLGHGCRIASMASIYGFNYGHQRTDIFIKDQPIIFKGVTLGNDVWVGANAIILDGVNIGNHSIVAAGAVVTKSFPPYSILAGNPAKRVRDRRKGPLAIYRLEDKNSGLKYHFDIDFSSYISCSNGFPLRGWVLHSDLDSIIIKTKTSSDVLSINRKRPDVINHFNEGVNNKIDCGFDYFLDMIDYYSIYIKTSINTVHLADIIQEEIITNE